MSRPGKGSPVAGVASDIAASMPAAAANTPFTLKSANAFILILLARVEQKMDLRFRRSSAAAAVFRNGCLRLAPPLVIVAGGGATAPRRRAAAVTPPTPAPESPPH